MELDRKFLKSLKNFRLKRYWKFNKKFMFFKTESKLKKIKIKKTSEISLRSCHNRLKWNVFVS